MEWLRWQKNPWGQEILRGLAWDLAWLAMVAGLLAVAVHMLLYVWRWRPKVVAEAVSPEDTVEVPGLDRQRLHGPDRVLRHTLASRLFHWSMAASVFILLFTAFLPILGLKFSWVTPHWIAGLVLSAAILFHIVHASFWKGLGFMWITPRDLRDGWLVLRQIVGLAEPAPGKPGKNPLENKLFHHLTSLATLATIVTGLMMMVRVDTPFWRRNPYLLPDSTWGVIYVVHGAASVALITLIIAHIYFAIRPEKRWITRSMLVGWIPLHRYLEHHDPERWPVVPQRVREATRSEET
ncbi:hypothetical protein NKDENANG_00621 [Candidatus Entotheonellaceae bacterium PAL068K]